LEVIRDSGRSLGAEGPVDLPELSGVGPFAWRCLGPTQPSALVLDGEGVDRQLLVMLDRSLMSDPPDWGEEDLTTPYDENQEEFLFFSEVC